MNPSKHRTENSTTSRRRHWLEALVQPLERRVLLSFGQLDPTFGSAGTVITDVTTNESTNGVAVQKDGKIVVVGSATNGSNLDFLVARYNVNGTPDKTFGGSGRVLTDFGYGNDIASKVVIQSDGEIVVAGTAYNGSENEFAVARYNPDGSLDRFFNNRTIGFRQLYGTNELDLAGNNQANAIALAPSGDIVVAGTTTAVNAGAFAVAQFLSNGTLDPLFGFGGVVITNFYSDSTDGANAVAVQSNGMIVALGTTNGGSTPQPIDMALARYDSRGNLDQNFGAGGLRVTDFNSNNELLGQALAIQPNGRIVCGGTIMSSALGFVFGRLLSNGSVDTSFQGPSYIPQGSVSGVTPAGTDALTGMVLQPDGKILASGIASPFLGNLTYNGMTKLGLVRLNSNGSPDTTFDAGAPDIYATTTGGTVTVDFGGAHPAGANAIALAPDGRIVIAGYVANELDSGSNSIAIARFQADATSASIEGNVFNDANGNEIKDPNDGGIAGVKVYLDSNHNGVPDSTERSVVTGFDGSYQFANLAAGTYRVRPVLPTGRHETTPSLGYHDVTLAEGQDSSGGNFGLTKSAAIISGTVFNDANGDKKRDTYKGVLESGLVGWTVYLDANNNGRRDAGEQANTTDAKGNFAFPGLPSGNYHVRVVPPPKWRLTTAASYTLTTSATSSTRTGENFGFIAESTLKSVPYRGGAFPIAAFDWFKLAAS